MNSPLYTTYLKRLSNYKGFIELIRETTAKNMDAVDNALQEFQVNSSLSELENASNFFYLVSIHYFLIHHNNASQVFARHTKCLSIMIADDVNPLRQQSLYSMESDLASLVSYSMDLKTKEERIERLLDATRHKILMARLSMNTKGVKRLKKFYQKQESSLVSVTALRRKIQSLITEKTQVIEEKKANECEIEQLANGKYAVFCNHHICFTGTKEECQDFCRSNEKRVLEKKE